LERTAPGLRKASVTWLDARGFGSDVAAPPLNSGSHPRDSKMHIVLGARQLATLVISLAVVGIVGLLATRDDLDAWYWREVVGAALREDLGFETGRVDVNFGDLQMRLFAVTSVRPGGGFDRADIRIGDVFFSYHGQVDSEFYYMLEKARGTVTTLEFRRSPDWHRRSPDWHTVRISVEVPPKQNVREPS
jgi:hypothetical protein